MKTFPHCRQVSDATGPAGPVSFTFRSSVCPPHRGQPAVISGRAISNTRRASASACAVAAPGPPVPAIIALISATEGSGAPQPAQAEAVSLRSSVPHRPQRRTIEVVTVLTTPGPAAAPHPGDPASDAWHEGQRSVPAGAAVPHH